MFGNSMKYIVSKMVLPTDIIAIVFHYNTNEISKYFTRNKCILFIKSEMLDCNIFSFVISFRRYTEKASKIYRYESKFRDR